MRSDSAGIVNMKDKKLKETTAQVMTWLSGVQWPIRTRGLTRHLSQESKENHTAKHHFPKSMKEFQRLY